MYLFYISKYSLLSKTFSTVPNIGDPCSEFPVSYWSIWHTARKKKNKWQELQRSRVWVDQCCLETKTHNLQLTTALLANAVDWVWCFSWSSVEIVVEWTCSTHIKETSQYPSPCLETSFLLLSSANFILCCEGYSLTDHQDRRSDQEEVRFLLSKAGP